jgi:predicted ester cyclase
MSRTDIETLLARHHEAFASLDAAALAAQHLPDGIFESPAAGRVQGRAPIERVYKYWFNAFPDMRFTWDPAIVDGDRAALFWDMAGTLKGQFFGVGIAGARIEFNGAALYVFRDGGIAVASHVFDFSAVLMKAGVLKARPA